MNKSINILLVLAVTISGFSVLLISIPSEVRAQYEPHDPIEIMGDEDFSSQAADEGWPGDGTEGNPYTIQGYEINASMENGIYIRSTTVHFIIKNIRIIYDERWGDTGILLIYVQNGIIDGCQINVGHSGFHIMSCSNISIINNYIDSKGFGDIRISTSITITIANNSMRGDGLTINGENLTHHDSHSVDSSNTVNGKPIYYWTNEIGGEVPQGAGQVFLVNCTNVTVSRQDITNTYVGIELVYSEHNTINNNNVSVKEGFGISLTKSNNNDIITNILNSEGRNSGGIKLYSSNMNNILGNEISNGTSGMKVRNSFENVIKNNTMKKNGINIEGYWGNNYESNIIDLSNTVNGKPIYYWRDRTNGSIPSNAGQVIVINCTDVVIENLEITNTTTAIIVGHSSNITVRNNVLHSNELYGIGIEYSNQCILVNNDIQDNQFGIDLSNSDSNEIKSNAIVNNHAGIWLSYSDGNSINDNHLSNEYSSIQLWYSYHNIIENNTIFESFNGGIYLTDSYESDIINNNIFSNGIGINFNGAYDNIVIGNDISISERGLIGLCFTYDSNNNMVMNNSISGFRDGIEFENSIGCSILNNNISNNENGVLITESSQINISYNSIDSNNETGIYIESSEGVEINHNEVTFNHNQGIDISDSLHMNISHNNIMHNSIGFEMDDSSNVTIYNNTISHNSNWGVQIDHSTMINISNNNVNDNREGIYFDFVEYSIIANNHIENNELSGIALEYSLMNTIVWNNISNNSIGISLEATSGNTIHHNPFIMNLNHIRQRDNNDNTWNDGRREGNFWDDYYGFDTNEDGVGDTKIPHYGVDLYPLTDRKGTNTDDSFSFLLIYFTILIITSIIVIIVLWRRKSKGDSSDGIEGTPLREL
jgi:parallel beta-helix repeat protein